jgi:hypothetical protein
MLVRYRTEGGVSACESKPEYTAIMLWASLTM